ncbi:MAG TPA: ATP-dependent DNA helicase, partial [Candidatus Saccharimonadales bacterium]
IAQANLLAAELSSYEEEPYDLITYEPLHEVIKTALQMAIDQAEADSKTKPLSQFKSTYCERDDQGELTLKDVKRSRRLRAVAGVYYDYLIAMQGKSLYDFDDMILRTVHAFEVFADLRMNLQEQYQYLLVDEFQDTNDAQMRILWNLTNNPVSDGRPNVCVVGDDDQAIYRFQGANISNVLGFRDLYRDVAVITLRDNYRSAEPVLSVARATVLHAVERLENTMSGVDKTLTAHHQSTKPQVRLTRYPDESSEYAELATRIRASRQARPNATIAVITRHHRQLQAMLPYLQRAGIPVRYDRRDNVLQSPPVLLLELLADTVTSLAGQRLDEANGLMPELLAHPSWQLEAAELWRLSLTAYTERKYWLDVMLANEGSRLHDIAQWLLETAHLSLHEPMEYMLDTLSGFPSEQIAEDGNAESEDDLAPSTPAFRSPLYQHFFKLDRLRTDAGTYLTYLDALTAIRRKVREYRPEGEMVLDDFVDCLNRYEQLGLGIQASGRITQGETPVELLTAHRSKGLEFDQVYVVGLSDNIWGETARSRGRLISYPSNLAIGIAGDGSDEHVRLLYVALTRAKDDLLMSLHSTDPAGKALLPVAYLAHVTPEDDTSAAPMIQRIETSWHGHILPAKSSDMQEMLRGRLDGYRLSATHLTNYLDVSRGGPERFLMQNLLRFPQAMGPSAAYGSAVHAVLHRAHTHLNATGQRRPIEDLLGDYETQLNEYQLATEVHEHFLKKGVDVLSNYFANRYDSFTAEQLAEQSFISDTVEVDQVRLSGIVDMIDINNDAKTIIVTDYKTGRPTSGWQGKTDYEKIKLHHYRQQLMFYKLLIENSRRFTGYTVTSGVIEYVEPDNRGVLSRLELTYDYDELTEFRQLLGAVWDRICNMKFDNVSDYEQNLRGIKQFEADLLSDD